MPHSSPFSRRVRVFLICAALASADQHRPAITDEWFTYDAYGNVTTSGSGPFQPGYGSKNQTQCGAYDADGNATNDCEHTYSWDAYGRPTTIDGVSITYDALGRAVEYDSGGYTQIYYSPTGFKMQVVSGANSTAYAPMPGGGASVWGPSGFYYRHGDWLGSSRLASTGSRTVYYDAAYAPFGQPYAETGTTDRNFTGMDQQIVSGIYDFPAREYNGDEGRWPSPDPAGLASVNPADPQTWNRYAYVRNAPLFMTDPTGMGDDWGGANGEDPYCLEDFCANGMPDYYGNDYNANDWVQAPDSGFGCMWNGSINTLRCPTNDCVPSTDAFGCASFYGPQSVSPSPTWAAVSTFFGNLVSINFWKSEVSNGGCLRDFGKATLAAANPLGSDYSPSADVGAGAMDVGDATRQAAATAYAIRRGLVVERRSSIYRDIRGGVKTSLAEGALAYADTSMGQGVLQEYKDAMTGVCK